MTTPATRSRPTQAEARAWICRRVGQEWPSGTRLPPIPELAREMGVGQGTAYRAVRELAQQGVLHSRRKRGTIVAGAASAQATPAVSPLLHTSAPRHPLADKNIHMVLCTAVSIEFRPIIEAFQAHASHLGATLRTDTFDFRDYPRDLSHYSADALLVINNIETICNPRQVIVVINTAIETYVPNHARYDVVSVEQEQGGFLAGAHALACGRRTACFVGVPPLHGRAMYDFTSSLRLEGFERGWQKALRPEHLLATPSYDMSGGAKASAKYLTLNPRPELIFAASDDLALGIIMGLMSHGLKPGRDYQIIGFDGQVDGRQLADGPLSTVAVPGTEMGLRAAELLADRLAHPDRPPRRLYLGCTFFPGATAIPCNDRIGTASP